MRPHRAALAKQLVPIVDRLAAQTIVLKVWLTWTEPVTTIAMAGSQNKTKDKNTLERMSR